MILIVHATVPNVQGSVEKLSPQEVPRMLTLSFGAAPLRTVRASSGLSLGDSFSTLPFGFVTVTFTLFELDQIKFNHRFIGT